jgi:HD superfamily phosphohydrolase YqeK
VDTNPTSFACFTGLKGWVLVKGIASSELAMSLGFNNNKFQEIWELALPYQDARDDEGHGEVVTDYAIKLCKIEGVNEEVVVPAAILHDIGWSRLSGEERMLIFDHSIDLEVRLKARYKHQEEGVKLGRELLDEVGYLEDLVEQILEIISEHDTREGFFSEDEAAVRDADKLWRFSKVGFWDDVEKSKITPEYYCEKLKSKINELGFFYFDSSRKMAVEELNQRRREFKG